MNCCLCRFCALKPMSRHRRKLKQKQSRISNGASHFPVLAAPYHVAYYLADFSPLLTGLPVKRLGKESLLDVSSQGRRIGNRLLTSCSRSWAPVMLCCKRTTKSERFRKKTSYGLLVGWRPSLVGWKRTKTRKKGLQRKQKQQERHV